MHWPCAPRFGGTTAEPAREPLLSGAPSRRTTGTSAVTAARGRSVDTGTIAMKELEQHSPATELAAHLAELRAKAREIAASWRVPPAERERLLRLNAAEIAAASLRFRAMTDPARLAPAASTERRHIRYRCW
jgi:hypothetical protein